MDVPTHRNLSAIISALLPNSLTQLNLLASCPSKKSVKAPITKIAIIFVIFSPVKIRYITMNVIRTLLIVRKFGIFERTSWPVFIFCCFMLYLRWQALKVLRYPYLDSGVEESGVLARPITLRSHGSNPASAIFYVFGRNLPAFKLE